ncbi:MAG: DUF364 domain-containing protein [Anaerolineaceae bacterium]
MKQSPLYDDLINTLPDGLVRQVSVGVLWTTVVVEVEGRLQGGLAATLQNPEYEHTRTPLVKQPGRLTHLPARELAGLAASESHTEASIGLAAINALLPRNPERYLEREASDWLIEQGAGKNVAMIGHFHFIEELRAQVQNLWVLELDPRPGDFHASEAPRILPQADVVAITATTLINHTFEALMRLCRPDARVMILGPSTPLAPVLFDHGVEVLAGTLVEDPIRTAEMAAQGGTSRQFKPFCRQVFLQKA